MDCPRDHGKLTSTEVASLRIDRCAQCGGSWYDLDELRLLKDKESQGDYSWIDIDLWKDRDKFRAARQQRLTCPKAGHPMTTVHYGDSPITVDLCPKCKGVWLDKDEYDEIVSYLEKVVDSSTVGDYIEDLKDEFVEVFKGHESPISELKHLDRVLYLLQLRFKVEHPLLSQYLPF